MNFFVGNMPSRSLEIASRAIADGERFTIRVDGPMGVDNAIAKIREGLSQIELFGQQVVCHLAPFRTDGYERLKRADIARQLLVGECGYRVQNRFCPNKDAYQIKDDAFQASNRNHHFADSGYVIG